MVELVIPGRAVPQPRHRATRGGRMYLPSSAPVRAFKRAIEAAAKAAIRKPIDGPVKVTVVCWFARPASHLGKGGKTKPKAPLAPGKNLGDVDNLAKAVLDAMTGIVFHDDSQVVELLTLKRWEHADMTHIEVEPMGAPCHAGSR